MSIVDKINEYLNESNDVFDKIKDFVEKDGELKKYKLVGELEKSLSFSHGADDLHVYNERKGFNVVGKRHGSVRYITYEHKNIKDIINAMKDADDIFGTKDKDHIKLLDGDPAKSYLDASKHRTDFLKKVSKKISQGRI